MREDFGTLRLPESAKLAFPPERDALFSLVCAHISDAALETIAKADYENDWKAHLAALKRIQTGTDLDRPIDWVPGEVLSLYRWSEIPASDAGELHLARAFSAAALLRLPDQNDNRAPFDHACLAPLIESTLALGEPYRSALARYLTWSLGQLEPWEEDFLFHAFGLWTVVAHRGAQADLADTLGTWVVESHAHILPWHAAQAPDAETFLDIPFVSTDANAWQRLGQALKTRLVKDPRQQAFLETLTAPKSFRRKVKKAEILARAAAAAAPCGLKELYRLIRNGE